MKKKLTLTVKKSVIESAKLQAKRKGMSLSQMFEEIFENQEINDIKTEQQRAADRLLQKLEKADSIETKNDKDLLKSHVKRKYS